MKPLMAVDRLQVLRRPNQDYDILLFECDLKPNVPKERRQELIKDLPESELIKDNSDSGNEEHHQEEKNQKRRKRRTALTAARVNN